LGKVGRSLIYKKVFKGSGTGRESLSAVFRGPFDRLADVSRGERQLSLEEKNPMERSKTLHDSLQKK